MKYKQKQILRSTLQNSLIYIMITVIPSILTIYILAQQHMQETEHEHGDKAQWYAHFHSKNIETFIGETTSRLEMLATLINIQRNNLDNVEEILKETHEKDPRFSGFYWANPDGELLISSNPLTSAINVGDRQYFQQALKTGKTSISDAHIGRVTGRYIITIAIPTSDNGQIEGVLLASLRLDKMEEAIKDVIKDEIVLVVDNTGQSLIHTRSLAPGERSIDYSTQVAHLPWTVTAKVIPKDDHVYQHVFLQYITLTLIVTNILFVFVLYLRLKRKVRKEQEQIEKQKLELVGNLAASTAHEIRNPLTGIKGLVTLLSEEYTDSKSQFYFDIIQTEITRINAIVSELLVLGKPSAYRLYTCNANLIVKEIEPIIHSEANFMNVELIIRYADDDLPILCAKDHIKQVILNLSKNSLHAMPNGGTLSISLEKRANACLIRVKDNGTGIPKDVLDQVFNPFFTMKKGGSGLGLTVCKRIIDTYGGSMSIESVLHEGTEVEIVLPLDTESNSNL